MHDIYFDRYTNQLYWALISYSRWWLSTDAPFLTLIRENSGNLNDNIASKIMTNYNIARGFGGRKSEGFKNAIARANEAAGAWPTSLLCRFHHCEQLAKEWKRYGETRNLQISAATKLMWFLRPIGWTMFDRFASRGLGVTSATNFYTKLDRLGFDKAIATLTALIEASDWSSLPASKIIDSYLMQRGKKETLESWVTRAHAYLEALPANARESLVDLANRAQDTLGDNFLPM
ncbi:MAG: hypothetical protein P9C36_06710 [Defluviicoccus sp.]|nr:hypothetical protein [Defluviicoccus sp.]MDG4592300.1 hypothetical protein [Defluviicoccus sp.]MDS4011612.1 hypothetical protein [Defluviicoccus sp.]